MTNYSDLPRGSAERAKVIGNAIASTALFSQPGAYHELFTHLRAEEPVAWADPDGYRPFWVVSKYEDIKAVEGAKERFVNRDRTLLRQIAVDEQIAKLTGGRPFLMDNLTNMDGKWHQDHRNLTHVYFTPGKIKGLEGDLRGYAREYIDRMLASGGECDFVKDVAVWYPLRVILHILGVPEEDEPLMLRLTQQMFGPDDPEIRTEPRTDIITTVQSMKAYFKELTDERRRNPRDDIATILANATIDGEPIGELQLLSYYILIATAGHDTTSSTTAGGLLALLQNPDEMTRLRADPSLLPGAIDEMLRWVSPVSHFFRTATEDCEVRGTPIKAGESLMMCYPSANRDEEVFEEPFRFNISRRNNRHLAFGYGAHVCLGQHLAKMEVRIFYEELLRRVADIELAGEPRWVQTNFVGGLKSLPVRFRAA